MPDSGNAPGGPAAHELERLIRLQVEDVRAGVDGMRHDLDTMVHDGRVAIRRLRVMVRIFRKHLDPAATTLLRGELSWLFGVLGPTRDAQVLQARLATSVAETCPDDPAARTLLVHLDRDYAAGAAAARLALAGTRVAALQTTLGDLAGARLVTGPPDPSLLYDEQTADLADLLVELGVLSGQPPGPTHDERLHDVRKSVKRVRYGRQAAATIGGQNAHDEVQAGLVRLQELLGEHHDASVMRRVLASAALEDVRLVRATDLLVVRERRAAAHAESRLKKVVRRLERATAEQHDAPGAPAEAPPTAAPH